jgi:hypothetical protein
MQLPSEKLELCVFVYKNLTSDHVDGKRVSGYLADDVNYVDVVEALNNVDLFVDKDEENRYLVFRVGNNFVKSLDELVENTNTQVSFPERFYIADLDLFYEGNRASCPQSIMMYFNACQFYDSLSKLADHQGGIGSKKTLIILGKHKIEITQEYSSQNLTSLDGLQNFIDEYVHTGIHKDQKLLIIKTVLNEMFCGRISFADVLNCAEELFSRVSASYHLYVSEFSFKKVKAEIEKEKLDATVKLNKVFSDIQNQLLAVPAALVLAGGQMENIGGLSSKNLVIVLGVLVFSVFMDLLVRNQSNTLEAVNYEITLQREQIEAKHKLMVSQFSDVYRQIALRYDHQKRLLRVVSGLVCLTLAVTAALFFFYSIG